MHQVVMITKNKYGVHVENPKWCLVDPTNSDGMATLCNQEYFGSYGHADGDVAKVLHGGITCKSCLNDLKVLKSIRLTKKPTNRQVKGI
jgi:hypothetical protein